MSDNRAVIFAAGAFAGGMIRSMFDGMAIVPAVATSIVAAIIAGVAAAVIFYRGESRLHKRIRTGGR